MTRQHVGLLLVLGSSAIRAPLGMPSFRCKAPIGVDIALNKERV